MSKRNQNEQDKYQPSFDCTAFTEYPLDSLVWNVNNSNSPSYPRSPSPLKTMSNKSDFDTEKIKSSLEPTVIESNSVSSKNNSINTNTISKIINIGTNKLPLRDEKENDVEINGISDLILASDANSEETLTWLFIGLINILKLFQIFLALICSKCLKQI